MFSGMALFAQSPPNNKSPLSLDKHESDCLFLHVVSYPWKLQIDPVILAECCEPCFGVLNVL